MDPGLKKLLGGVNSTWPNIFYIYWDPRELGENAAWPRGEYIIDVEPQADTFGGKPTYMSGGNFIEAMTASKATALEDYLTITDALAGSIKPGYLVSAPSIQAEGRVTQTELVSGNTYKIYIDRYWPYTGSWSVDITGVYYAGANPAAIINQLLFSPLPFGMGKSQADYNMQDLYDMAVYFAEDGTEPFPARVNMSDGNSVKNVLEALLTDLGVSPWLDTSTGLWRFTAAREGGAEVTLTQGQFEETDIDIDFDYSTLEPATSVFVFEDGNRRLNRSSVQEDDDGFIRFSEDPSARKIDMDSVTDFTTAQTVSTRRSGEFGDKQKLPLKVPFGIIEGNTDKTFRIEGLTAPYRIESIATNLSSYEHKVTFVNDAYSVGIDFVPIDVPPPTQISQSVFPDPLVRIIETSRSVSPDSHGVYIASIRAHGQIIGSDVYMSADGSTYVDLAVDKQYTTGGLLDSDFLSSEPSLVEQGPTFTPVGPDILNVADLSGADELWRSGEQLCLINDELFYLRGVTALSATQYRLDGLLRARLGTGIGDHLTGDAVYILPASALDLLAPTFLAAGRTVYAKTTPATTTEQLDPSQVNAVSKLYKGGGYKPLPVDNLTTADNNLAYLTGQDVSFRWSYRNALSTSGAGDLIAGETGTVAGPEGTFTISFLTTGDSLVRSVSGLTTNTYTYTNATLQSDFGLEPTQFKVKVTNDLNGLSSEEEVVTITKY